MGELEKYNSQLPSTFEELRDFILIGKERLKAHQAKIRAINKVDVAEDARRAALEDGQDAGIALICAESQLGELLSKIPKKPPIEFSEGNRISLPPGIDKKLSHEAQTINRNPERVQQSIEKFIEEGRIPTPDAIYKDIKNIHVSNNSGENEWYTPLEIIESAMAVMGSIDLDPASSELANKIVKAGEFYTSGQNGLLQKWHGNVWMNPPYSQPLISEFSNKLVDELKNINQACVLTNNATETEWYQNMMINCDAVCFIRGRVKFIDKLGNASGAPLQGQTIMYFGNNLDGFNNEFKKHGICMWSREEGL